MKKKERRNNLCLGRTTQPTHLFLSSMRPIISIARPMCTSLASPTFPPARVAAPRFHRRTGPTTQAYRHALSFHWRAGPYCQNYPPARVYCEKLAVTQFKPPAGRAVTGSSWVLRPASPWLPRIPSCQRHSPYRATVREGEAKDAKMLSPLLFVCVGDRSLVCGPEGSLGCEDRRLLGNRGAGIRRRSFGSRRRSHLPVGSRRHHLITSMKPLTLSIRRHGIFVLHRGLVDGHHRGAHVRRRLTIMDRWFTK
jgi:hypothetical protein